MESTSWQPTVKVGSDYASMHAGYILNCTLDYIKALYSERFKQLDSSITNL